MEKSGSRRSAEEVARRGQDVYERRVRTRVEGEAGGANDGRFVVLDVDSGDYEVADEALDATARLRERRGPDAVFYLMRVGRPAAFRMRRGGPSSGSRGIAGSAPEPGITGAPH